MTNEPRSLRSKDYSPSRERCPNCGAIVPRDLASTIKRYLNAYPGSPPLRDICAHVWEIWPLATKKQIYDALGGLTRRGFIRRLSYGRYTKRETPELEK